MNYEEASIDFGDGSPVYAFHHIGVYQHELFLRYLRKRSLNRR